MKLKADDWQPRQRRMHTVLAFGLSGSGELPKGAESPHGTSDADASLNTAMTTDVIGASL
jgi:hypothetical protein